MTNREWLNTLTDEEFTDWLINDEYANGEVIDGIMQMTQPSPKLKTLKWSYTISYSGVLEWLGKERK